MSTVSEEVLKESRMRQAAARASTPISEMVTEVDKETIDSISRRGLVIPSIKDVYNRFVIREFNAEDAPRVREMNNDLFFAPLRHIYGPFGFVNSALKQQKQGKARNNYFLAIADTRTGEVIGSVMLFDFRKDRESKQAEVAYFIDPSYQNKKIATDASVRMLGRLGLALGVKNLVATVHPNNEFSKKILATLGFKEISKAYTSKYREDPSKRENYAVDPKRGWRTLKFAPRIKFATTFSHFLQQQDKIITTDSEINAIEAARIERARIREERNALRVELLRPRRLPLPKSKLVAG